MRTIIYVRSTFILFRFFAIEVEQCASQIASRYTGLHLVFDFRFPSILDVERFSASAVIDEEIVQMVFFLFLISV